jgi:hypothetical protein
MVQAAAAGASEEEEAAAALMAAVEDLAAAAAPDSLRWQQLVALSLVRGDLAAAPAPRVASTTMVVEAAAWEQEARFSFMAGASRPPTVPF